MSKSEGRREGGRERRGVKTKTRDRKKEKERIKIIDKGKYLI